MDGALFSLMTRTAAMSSTSRDQQAPAGGCPLDGHRDAGGFQQAARQFVVARNRFGQCTGAIGLSRSNPAKVHALTELEKALIIQAPNRNLPLAGRAEDRVLGGRDREPVGELREFMDLPRHVERPVVNGRQAKLTTGFKRGAGQVFVLVLDGDLVDAILRSLARRPKPTSVPARLCSSSTTCSRICAW